MDRWTQLWVRHPQGGANTPTAMQHVDAGIQAFGATFCAPGGTPIRETDGTFEVRVFSDPGFIKFALTDRYHLTIVREQVHE